MTYSTPELLIVGSASQLVLDVIEGIPSLDGAELLSDIAELW